jgi:hypothetical protein
LIDVGLQYQLIRPCQQAPATNAVKPEAGIVIDLFFYD